MKDGHEIWSDNDFVNSCHAFSRQQKVVLVVKSKVSNESNEGNGQDDDIDVKQCFGKQKR